MSRLTVTRIFESFIDVESMVDYPSGFFVSNGHREVFVPTEKDKAVEIVKLMLEGATLENIPVRVAVPEQPGDNVLDMRPPALPPRIEPLPTNPQPRARPADVDEDVEFDSSSEYGLGRVDRQADDEHEEPDPETGAMSV